MCKNPPPPKFVLDVALIPISLGVFYVFETLRSGRFSLGEPLGYVYVFHCSLSKIKVIKRVVVIFAFCNIMIALM